MDLLPKAATLVARTWFKTGPGERLTSLRTSEPTLARLPDIQTTWTSSPELNPFDNNHSIDKG